jgi:hypothetical protein
MDIVQVVKEAFLLLPSTGPEDEVVMHIMEPAEGLAGSPAKWRFLKIPPLEVSSNSTRCRVHSHSQSGPTPQDISYSKGIASSVITFSTQLEAVMLYHVLSMMLGK